LVRGPADCGSERLGCLMDEVGPWPRFPCRPSSGCWSCVRWR